MARKQRPSVKRLRRRRIELDRTRNTPITVIGLSRDGHSVTESTLGAMKPVPETPAERSVVIEPVEHPTFGNVFAIKAQGFGYLDWCYSFKSDAEDQKHGAERLSESLIRQYYTIQDPKTIPNIG